MSRQPAPQFVAAPHPATLTPARLTAECQQTTTRRSGPGGQHRNKVETAVVLTHRPTGVSAEANERRSQEANRREAVHRLRVRLAVEVRAAAAQQIPSTLWQSRTVGQRIAVNPTHDDFPALLAEALDRLAARDYDLAAAAGDLGVSTTQLGKLIHLAPAAWQNLQVERRQRGLRPLK